MEVIGIDRHYLYYDLSKCNGVLVMVYANHDSLMGVQQFDIDLVFDLLKKKKKKKTIDVVFSIQKVPI